MFMAFFEKRHLFKLGMMFLLIATGCGKQEEAPLVEVTHVHSDLSHMMKASFANMVKESKSPGAVALMKSMASVQKMLGPRSNSTFPAEIDLEFVTRMIEDMFANEAIKEIFSEANVVNRTDYDTTYEIKSSMCSKLGELMPGGDDSFLDTCSRFLSKNALHIKVSRTVNQKMHLELWYANKDKAEEMQRVVAFTLSKNLLGLTVNLDGAQKFVDAMMTFGDNPKAPGLAELGIHKLSGEATLRLQFKSEDAPSSCKNNEDFCFVINVDRAIDVDLDLGKPLTIKLDASPIENPSLMLSANSETGIVAFVNLGALQGSFGEDSAFLEAMRFNLTLPQLEEGLGFQFLLENFRAGPSASVLKVFGKQFLLDFASNLRTLDRIYFAMDNEQAMFETSPLDFMISMVDELDSKCLTRENIRLTSDEGKTTKIKFAMPSQSLPIMPSLNGKQGSCSEYNLFIYNIWSMLGVSSEDCEQSGLLNVEEGMLRLTYDYVLNNVAGQPSVLEAEAGQCMRM